MMTDTKPIAELMPCGRRWLLENQDGVQVWCRPPTRPPGLTNAEAIQNPAKWFAKKRVSCATCLACKEQEPERAPEKAPEEGFDITDVADPIKDRMPPGRNIPAEAPEVPPPRILDDATIVYEKVGWEPPPVPPGYKRKSDDFKSRDAWILVRIEPMCKHCKLVQIRKPGCDCLRIVPTCTYHGKSENIQLDQCSSCPNK